MEYMIQGKNGPKVIGLNRRKAIRERCLNCSVWSPKEVLNCQFSNCYLFSFRTGQGKQNPKGRMKAIRKYCLWCANGQRFEILNCPSVDCPLFPYRKTKMERPDKINSMPKRSHIEAVFEHKNENEYGRVHKSMVN